eukprot:TRINITY_DN10862_c0_g1_i2.p1 TRINITY_DN10862_c0_g1~~TRINITY_DN10862_c0_g1_i2.p1  ORF type:complete len:377 (-),score=31.17 TRINITY_DN10862_c0_g1_i2:19-1149(-)
MVIPSRKRPANGSLSSATLSPPKPARNKNQDSNSAVSIAKELLAKEYAHAGPSVAQGGIFNMGRKSQPVTRDASVPSPAKKRPNTGGSLLATTPAIRSSAHIQDKAFVPNITMMKPQDVDPLDPSQPYYYFAILRRDFTNMVRTRLKSQPAAVPPPLPPDSGTVPSQDRVPSPMLTQPSPSQSHLPFSHSHSLHRSPPRMSSRKPPLEWLEYPENYGGGNSLLQSLSFPSQSHTPEGDRLGISPAPSLACFSTSSFAPSRDFTFQEDVLPQPPQLSLNFGCDDRSTVHDAPMLFQPTLDRWFSPQRPALSPSLFDAPFGSSSEALSFRLSPSPRYSDSSMGPDAFGDQYEHPDTEDYDRVARPPSLFHMMSTSSSF